MSILNTIKLLSRSNHARHFLSSPIGKRLSSTKILQELEHRGFVNSIFPTERNEEIEKLLTKGPQTVYAGFDATADSLHIGNLLVLYSLLHWQRAGHNVIALIGDFTPLLGDPSGHSQDRKLITKEVIQENAAGIRETIERIFNNHEQYFWTSAKKLPPIKIVENSSWYNDLDKEQLLDIIGKFRIGPLLNRTSVKTRLEESPEGMKATEFLYQIFQSYDWLHLYEKYNCTFQIGGKDQLGNINSGYHLIKKIHNKPVYGLTLPLITSLTGDKLGKSAGNAVWLDENKTSPYDLYQYFFNLDDKLVESYLNLFTVLPKNNIETMIQEHLVSEKKRHGQKKVAENITKLVHGPEGLSIAKKATNAFFNKSLESLMGLGEKELQQIFRQTPTVKLQLEPGITAIDMAMKARCFANEVDANAIIKAGGFHINMQRITNPSTVLLQGDHILPNSMSVIRVGKKNHYLVKWKDF